MWNQSATAHDANVISQMYDALDLSSQPGTATLTPVQLPVSWPPSTVWPTHLHCLHLWALTNKDKQTGILCAFLVIFKHACEQHFNKAHFFQGHFSVKHTSVCKYALSSILALSLKDSGIPDSATHTSESSLTSKTTSVLSVVPD